MCNVSGVMCMVQEDILRYTLHFTPHILCSTLTAIPAIFFFHSAGPVS
jgi:hypothetical protein